MTKQIYVPMFAAAMYDYNSGHNFIMKETLEEAEQALVELLKEKKIEGETLLELIRNAEDDEDYLSPDTLLVVLPLPTWVQEMVKVMEDVHEEAHAYENEPLSGRLVKRIDEVIAKVKVNGQMP